MATTIHTLVPGDTSTFAALITLFRQAFGTEPGNLPPQDYLENRLKDPSFLVMVARQDGVLAGGLTAYRLHNYYTQKPMLYLYDIAVDAAFRRRGLGRALLDHLSQYASELGYGEWYVQAEAADTDAVAFYRSRPYSAALETIQFSYERTG